MRLNLSNFVKQLGDNNIGSNGIKYLIKLKLYKIEEVELGRDGLI